MISFEELCAVDSELLLRAWAKRYVLSEIKMWEQFRAEGEDYTLEAEGVDNSLADALHDDLSLELRNYAQEYAKAAGLK